MEKKLIERAALLSLKPPGSRPSATALAPRLLGKEAVWISVIVLAQSLSPQVIIVTYVALTFWAIRSVRAALQALSVSTLVLFLNGAIFPRDSSMHTLKWILMAVVAARVAASSRDRPREIASWVWPLLLFTAVVSVLIPVVSEQPAVSGFKLGSFVVVASAVLLGFRDRSTPPAYWLHWFYTIHAVVVVLSLPLLATSLGYNGRDNLFQGILGQSQALGIYLMPTAVLVTAWVLLSRNGPQRVAAICMVLTWYLLYASGCRTAFLAAAIGISVVAVVTFSRRQSYRVRQRSRLIQACFIFACCLAILGIQGKDALLGRIYSFALKQQTEGASIDSETIGRISHSRIGQREGMIAAIQERPVMGIGFGLGPQTLSGETVREGFWELPVSAPVEAGFLDLAVPMQIGVVGSVCFVLLMIALSSPVVRFGAIPILMMFVTAFSVNFGEMIFFSVGGLGTHMWMLFACAYEFTVRNRGRDPFVMGRQPRRRPAL